MKPEKEEERKKFLESQNPDMCSLVRASFFAAERGQRLFNEFDSLFLNQLKNEWIRIQRRREQLNGFGDQDKEREFSNEHPLLFLRKPELLCDADLVTYLIGFGTHIHILVLGKQAMDWIFKML